MPASNLDSELFEIEAASPEANNLENETFVIRMRVQGTYRLQGTYQVREFLSDHHVDEKRIAFAIEELSRRRQVKVTTRVPKSRAA